MKAEEASSTEASARPSFPIAAVGASAGGLKAFQELLAELPEKPGISFVLVPHLSPEHPSLISTILQKSSRMPIREVTDEALVEPDHVYVIPPNSTLSMHDGQLRAIKPRLGLAVRDCINYYMVSLAETARERAIGIILSGTASDGATGIKAIKTEGGITFAQNETAEYSGMPQAAIATGAVDFVLSPAEIARELLRIARHPYLSSPDEGPPPEVAGGSTQELAEILGLLQKVTGVEFAHYKPSTLRRRIARRMAVQRVERLGDYLRNLKENPSEIRTLHDDILVTVTSFFREPESFQALKDVVFPALLEDRPARAAIRFWAPGCATGEEVYSLAIALLEFLDERGSQAAIQIFGSDLNDSSLQRARSGIYDASIAAELSPERLDRFFVRLSGDRYQVNKRIRDLCLFAKQDLTHDPPFSWLDLLSCRNVLIYLGPVLQKRVIPLFHYALKPRGFLMLGSSESVERFSDLFTPVDRKAKIYAKIPIPPGTRSSTTPPTACASWRRATPPRKPR